MHKVLFALIGIPLIELWVLISVGAEIGALSTIILCVLTAVVGLQLLRIQGFFLLRRVDERVARGEAPSMEMVEGVALSVGGVMLLFPGFVSDIVGFILLLPFTRQWLIKRMFKYYSVRASVYQAGTRNDDIIDADFERHDNDRLK